jgi:hypothetical protein
MVQILVYALKIDRQCVLKLHANKGFFVATAPGSVDVAQEYLGGDHMVSGIAEAALQLFAHMGFNSGR